MASAGCMNVGLKWVRGAAGASEAMIEGAFGLVSHLLTVGDTWDSGVGYVTIGKGKDEGWVRVVGWAVFELSTARR